MPVVTCPACATKLKAGDAFAGKTARCPRCGTILQLPAPSTSVASSRSRPDDDPPSGDGRPGLDAEKDRPRKKPKKMRQGRGVPLWAILGVVGVVFVGLVIGGSLLAYILLGSKDKSSATNSQANSSPSAPRAGEAAAGGGGVKYVPRESEKKLSEFLKAHEQENVTDAQVFAIMGEPTRRDAPIKANKNGQVLTVYKAYWEVPGSGVTSQIGFVNGRMNGAIIGLEVTPPGSANKK